MKKYRFDAEIKGGRGQLRGMHIRRIYDRLY